MYAIHGSSSIIFSAGARMKNVSAGNGIDIAGSESWQNRWQQHVAGAGIAWRWRQRRRPKRGWRQPSKMAWRQLQWQRCMLAAIS
jgi:hypothetical protein